MPVEQVQQLIPNSSTSSCLPTSNSRDSTQAEKHESAPTSLPPRNFFTDIRVTSEHISLLEDMTCLVLTWSCSAPRESTISSIIVTLICHLRLWDLALFTLWQYSNQSTKMTWLASRPLLYVLRLFLRVFTTTWVQVPMWITVFWPRIKRICTETLFWIKICIPSTYDRILLSQEYVCYHHYVLLLLVCYHH